jgi:hypothetical protein
MLLILAALLAQLLANSTRIALNQDYSVTLQPERSYMFEVDLPSSLPANSDFYFLVQWPVNDPLQNPFLDISTEDGEWSCYNSNDEFSGVCSIPGDQLTPNSTITAEVFCFVECALRLIPSMAPRLQMNLTDSHLFTAPAANALPVEVEIQVPLNLNYTQLVLYAQIESFEKASEGLEMYANIGDYSTEIPSRTDYDSSGQSIYWGGKGIFLSKEEVKPGQWIKLYLYLSQGMQVRLYGKAVFGNDFLIELGKTYFDFTSYQEDKVYVLDLAKTPLAGKTLSIEFVVYSGDPFVRIAMDSGFLTPLGERGAVSTSTYLITESMRNHSKFTGVVYIKVASSWSADYLLHADVVSRNFMSIFPDVSFYNELEPKDVFNYFFDDLIPIAPNASLLRTYSLRVDMIRGSVIFGVRRCKTAETGESLLGCTLNDSSVLNNSALHKTFEEIDLTIKKSDVYYYLVFQVNGSDCTRLNSTAAYYCSFHVAAIASASANVSDYTVTLNKRRYASTLREGELSRDLVFKDEYLYFRFLLSSLEDVLSITLYATVLEGDLYLLGSGKDEYPTMDSKADDLLFSVGNHLTFEKDQLAKAIYISVYGIELSEFTLGVKVTRKAHNATNSSADNGTSSQSKLALKLDLSQEFLFEETDTAATFLISTQQTMDVTAEVMQLSGTVNMEIRDGENKTVQCSNGSSSNNKISCSFTAKERVVYSAVVTAKKGDVQKFIIMYYKQDSCFSYSLNLPLYLSLAAAEKTCVAYSLSKLTELEVTTNAPLLSLLNQTLSMVVCLNGHCLAPTQSHHQQITKTQLVTYCKLTKVNGSNVLESCPITVTFAANSSVNLEVIVEEQGKDVGLFDGIVERVSSYELSHQAGKYFYYEIMDWSALKIFFTSLAGNSYYIALHFVEQTAFLKNSSGIYLPFRETDYNFNRTFETNFYDTVVYGAYTNVFTISAAVIDRFCDQCLLALSVYPWYSDSHRLSSFEIEVSQTETVLFLGSAKIGYLEADEIYNYQLEESAESDALLSIKDLNRESGRQEDCFSASLSSSESESPSFVERGVAYIKKGGSLSNLYVEAKADYCNYEVTYMRLDYPLLVATANRKFPFDSNKAGRMFMLYTHTSKDSFKVTQIINTGTLNVSASPIGNQTLNQLLQTDPKTLAFVSPEASGGLSVSNTSSSFCWNCQYLIALWSGSAVQAEVIISNENSSIPLSANGIIKERVGKGSRNYTFNSITAFNLTLTLIYGKVALLVLDPSKNVVVNVSLSSSQVFVIPHNNKTEDYSYDYNSVFTRYEISTTALADCSYTLKASKESLTSRLFEGIPFYHFFKQNETISLEFLNLNEASPASNSLNLLVDLTDFASKQTPKLNFSASLESHEGAAPSELAITSTSLSSEGVYNIELPLKQGTYYIRMEADLSVSTRIILVKQSLIHLNPSSEAIMFKEGIFELYSSYRGAMIEVFTCWGEVSIDASSSYNDLASTRTGSSEVVLEQSNYGGHYVINADRIDGEYFIKVGGRRSQQLELGYLITYHYYEPSDPAPYKLIDLADREITYRLTKGAVSFTFAPLAVRWDLTDSIDSVTVEYRLFIADSKNKVGQYANCRLGQIYEVFARSEDIGDALVEIPIDVPLP